MPLVNACWEQYQFGIIAMFLMTSFILFIAALRIFDEWEEAIDEEKAEQQRIDDEEEERAAAAEAEATEAGNAGASAVAAASEEKTPEGENGGVAGEEEAKNERVSQTEALKWKFVMFSLATYASVFIMGVVFFNMNNSWIMFATCTFIPPAILFLVYAYRNWKDADFYIFLPEDQRKLVRLFGRSAVSVREKFDSNVPHLCETGAFVPHDDYNADEVDFLYSGVSFWGKSPGKDEESGEDLPQPFRMHEVWWRTGNFRKMFWPLAFIRGGLPMHDYNMFYTICAGSICLIVWGVLIEGYGGFSTYTGYSLTCIIFGILIDAVVSYGSQHITCILDRLD